MLYHGPSLDAVEVNRRGSCRDSTVAQCVMTHLQGGSQSETTKGHRLTIITRLHHGDYDHGAWNDDHARHCGRNPHLGQFAAKIDLVHTPIHHVITDQNTSFWHVTLLQIIISGFYSMIL